SSRSSRSLSIKDEVVAAAPAKAKTETKAKSVAKEEVKVVEDAKVVEEVEMPVAETEVNTDETIADETAEENKE
ncbi:MAG TPA: hypothetical protein P5210_17015, partial [Draconibacterium sp.]|nr:hypothetical protein [Draconibacterium sp.]